MAIRPWRHGKRPWQETMATVRWSIRTISFHRQLSLQSILLIQSNCIPLSHPPTPVFGPRGPGLKRGSGTEKGIRYQKGAPVPKILGKLRNVYLASYFTPDHVAVDMGVFPSVEVQEYAYDSLYSMVYLGIGPPNHVTSHRSITNFNDDMATTKLSKPESH